MYAILRILVAFAIALAAVSAAGGRDIYVSNTAGYDGFFGRQPKNMPDNTGPVRTIARAVALAGQADRIILENTGEPYREDFTLMGTRLGGYASRKLVIEGNGAVLDGSAPVPVEAWRHYRDAVFRFVPPFKAYQQLFLNGRPVQRVFADPLAGGPPKMEPLQWCLHGGAIYFCVEKRKLPADYALSYARRRVGITLFHVHDVEIRDLTIQGFQLDGINAHNTARRITLRRVVCRGNGRAGLVVGGASLVTLQDSLLGDNGEAQVLTEPFSELHVSNTELLGNTAPALVQRGGRVLLEGKPVEGGLEEYLPDSNAAARKRDDRRMGPERSVAES